MEKPQNHTKATDIKRFEAGENFKPILREVKI
jgi:hypothetical protein